MILKTYTRLLTTDLESTVSTLRAVHGSEPHLSFTFDAWKLVAIGDVLVVAGTDETLAPIRGSLGPWIVDDIKFARSTLLANGASIISDIEDVATGRMMYVRHADGHVVEYVQWVPDLAEKFIFGPLRTGTLSSRI